MRIALLSVLLTQLVTSAPKPGHAVVQPTPADLGAKPGTRVMLFVDVTPKPNIHVYAPGNEFYIPITIKLNPQADVKAGKLAYPKSEIVTIADEKVSVFQKPFRLTQEVEIGKAAKAGSSLVVGGTVNYQACDDKVCFPPETAPVSWTIAVK